MSVDDRAEVEVRPGVTLSLLRSGPDAHGTGPTPFVLAHGLASNARMWDGVRSRLAAAGHPVAAVDLRGHGRSSKPDDGYDVPTVADDVARLVDALGWRRPVVVGQSWGGNVVVELAAARPDLVGGIACVDGGMIELRSRFPDWDEAAEALAPPRSAGTPWDQLEAMVRSSHPDWPETGIQGVLACFEPRADGTAAPWLSFERHLVVLRGLWEHDPFDRFAEVECGVMLMPARTPDASWTHDKEESVRRATAGVSSSVQVEWVDGHHDLHAEQPEAVAGRFLDAVGELW